MQCTEHAWLEKTLKNQKNAATTHAPFKSIPANAPIIGAACNQADLNTARCLLSDPTLGERPFDTTNAKAARNALENAA